MFKKIYGEKESCIENFGPKNPPILAAHTRIVTMFCNPPPGCNSIQLWLNALCQSLSPFQSVYSFLASCSSRSVSSLNKFILSSKAFDSNPQNKLLKELFTQIFSTPNLHPKSKPFFDHVFNFSIVDNRIWFRNYQVITF